MEPNWATEHLQTIRTLMERATVYRRTLAPIMLFTGALGLVAGVTGYCAGWNTTQSFGCLWLITGVLAALGAFFIARWQAFKEAEPFWTLPARRVVQALLPAWLVGFCLSLPPIFANAGNGALIITLMWLLFYGLGLHAAGFFMPRGIKVFGWIFIASTTLFACALPVILRDFYVNTNVLMGFFFGGLHLAHGGYLYWSEKTKAGGVNPETFQQLDRVIHEKGRLAIMSMLAAAPEFTFTELRDTLGMTDGNLTTHIRALQQAGYVAVTKSYQNKRPLTTCLLTAPGRAAFAGYINLLEQVVRQNKLP